MGCHQDDPTYPLVSIGIWCSLLGLVWCLPQLLSSVSVKRSMDIVDLTKSNIIFSYLAKFLPSNRNNGVGGKN